MGCVRDTGSEEELATVGKLLSEVDRCREPSSETLCQAIMHHSPRSSTSLSHAFLTASGPGAHFSHVPLRRNTSDSRYRIRMAQVNPSAWNVKYLTDHPSLPLAINTARMLSCTDRRAS